MAELVDINQYEVREHPIKAELREYGISIGHFANYLGLSYPYVCNMLNGHFKLPSKHEEKINNFLYSLEAQASEN